MKEMITTAPSSLSLDAYIYTSADTIYRTDSHTFETPTGANWSHYVIPMTETAGSYYADFPLAITTAGNYFYSVRLRSGGSAAPTDGVYAVGTVAWDGSAEVPVYDPSTEPDFLDLATVKAQLQISDTKYDAAITSYIPAAQDGIRNYLTHGVVARAYTEVRDGSGLNYMRVLNPPLNTLTQVIYDYDTANPVIVDGSNFLFNKKTGMFQAKPNSTVTDGFASERFQNVKIIYNGGWNPVPAPIIMAGAIICRELIYVANNQFHVGKKSVGDVSVMYSALATGNLALFAEAEVLLRPYKTVRY